MLSDIIDVRGHLNVNLEKTARCLRKKLSSEVLDPFGNVVTESTATAGVLVPGSGHAYSIREDKIHDALSTDIRNEYIQYHDNDESVVMLC